MSTVLVTGGTGFIGNYAILQLLAAGHTVRTTVRNPEREADARAHLVEGGMTPDAPLAFFTADLLQDAGWAEAVAGVDYVLHVASPFPAAAPGHEDELIVPAREGSLRVLRAARDAGVKRVVLTSSFAAIGYGHPKNGALFDETVWTDLSNDTGAYIKSKTIAERAAWDFVAKEGGPLELSVVNPVGVIGPVLGPDISTSILLVKRMLDGAVPGLPRIWFGLVDVRDVADLHIRAMTDPAAKGERFLAISGDMWSVGDIAALLKARMGAAASKVPSRRIPDWLVRVAAVFDKTLAAQTHELGNHRHATGAKAERMLGWKPRSVEESLVDTAESLIRHGLVSAPSAKAA